MDSTQRKGTEWTAIRGMAYRRREWEGQHSEEWESEGGTSMCVEVRKGVGGGRTATKFIYTQSHEQNNSIVIPHLKLHWKYSVSL